MAGYGYQHKSTAAYTFPQTDDWSKQSYASDHVCRPVIIDAEGRKRPIVALTPNHNSEYYVTRTTETVVREQIVSPFASEIKQPHNLRLPGAHEVVEEKRQRHPSPLLHDASPKAGEFFTKVQNEASKHKFGPMSASTWRQTAKPAGYGREFNNDWKNPTSNGFTNDVYDDNSHGRNKPISTTHSNFSTAPGFYKEPSSPPATNRPHYWHVDPVLVDTFDRKPTPTAWASPPNSNLTKPTSDIPTAIGILKEVAQPFISTAPSSWHTEPRYAETINNSTEEAAKRYGKFNFSPKPYAAENNYTTIDSREAARKYHGTTV